MAKDVQLSCSFCGRSKGDVGLLISGIDAHICDKRYNNPRSYCKLCACIKEQEYRKANPEKIRASNIKQAYKVSTERAYELMAIWNCESCGVELEKSEANVRTKNAQVVDHCHTTGEVRGVLCSGCNLALGHLSDSIEKITALKEYLIK